MVRRGKQTGVFHFVTLLVGDMNRLFKFVAFLLILAPLTARAELIRNYMEGTRPVGMGGAFLAVADDHNAIWYNPAGLGFMRNVSFNLVDITLGVDSVDTLNRFTNAVFNNDFENILRSDRQFNRFYVRPTFMGRYFAFSIYQSLNSFVNMSNLDTLDLNVDMFSYNDIGAIAAVGYPLLPNFSLGASVRVFARTGVDATLTSQSLLNELALSQSTDVTSAVYNSLSRLMGTGWAVGANLGFLFKVPVPQGYPEIKIAGTMEDFADTEFRDLGTERRPPNMKRTLNLGLSFKNRLSNGDTLTFAFDARRNFESLPFFKRAYAGIEYRNRYFGIRGGLYQANPTFGISIETPPHTRIHLSTYAAALDSTLWGESQRWYVMQLIIGFNPM
jgi:hypothetical protein